MLRDVTLSRARLSLALVRSSVVHRRTMSAIKKRRVPGGSLESNEAIANALNNAIKTSASAEMAINILHFMNQYEINWQDLKRHIECELLLHSIRRLEQLSINKALDISFSRVTWDQVTRLVGITPYYGLARVPVFQLQRARIPRQLFRSIVQDIAIYGALRAHHNVEAHSGFMSPVSPDPLG